MKPAFASVLSVMALAVAIPAWAAPRDSAWLIETFDGTIDEASWRVGSGDVIVPSGGYPGAYLMAQIDTTTPQIGSTTPPYKGDYRTFGVISLGIDINVLNAGFTSDHQPVSLVLSGHAAYPPDPGTECELVYVDSKSVPKPGGGWKQFDVKVPAHLDTLPQNWIVRGPCAGVSEDVAWRRVIGYVERVSFVLGDPDALYPFQSWDLGFDNARMLAGKRGTGPTITVDMDE